MSGASTASTVDQLITSNKVFVASKSYCPYCAATKKFFKDVYPEAKVIELDLLEDGSEIQSYLKEKTGQSTVPNIFIGGKHIGGNSDIQSIGKSKAQQLISAA